MFNKMSSSELLRKRPGNLLQNFLRHVLKMKSGEELQQRVYNAVLRRTIDEEDEGYVLTLTLLNNTKIKIDPSPLLDCITASGVALNNIKEIQAEMNDPSEKVWEAFNIQTNKGTVLQVEVKYHLFNAGPARASAGAAYSPRIYEMLQSSRLTQFR